MPEEIVLITGCSSGIGRATARAFLEEGWTVYATARDTDDIEELAELGCETAELDVTDDRQVERVVDRIVEEEGYLDCLVNNAGYAQPGPVEDVPVEIVHEQFDVNVYGPHRLARAVLPHMREQGDGTILNVSSLVGRLSVPGMGTYAGSKFAVEGITDALRVEVAEYGVDVVLVEPGPVDTQFNHRATNQLDALERSGTYETLYSILGDAEAMGGGGPGTVQPEAVAETILNAASCVDPAARYPVGSVAKAGVLTRFLPDSLVDGTYRLGLKLVSNRWVTNLFQ